MRVKESHKEGCVRFARPHIFEHSGTPDPVRVWSWQSGLKGRTLANLEWCDRYRACTSRRTLKAADADWMSNVIRPQQCQSALQLNTAIPKHVSTATTVATHSAPLRCLNSRYSHRTQVDTLLDLDGNKNGGVSLGVVSTYITSVPFNSDSLRAALADRPRTSLRDQKYHRWFPPTQQLST